MPPQPPKSIVLLGALDTKGPELAFVCDALVRHGWPVRVLHIGIREPAALPPALAAADVRHVEVSAAELARMGKVAAMTRIATVAGPQVADWVARGEAAGVLVLGGGVGTWVGAEVMRSLPFGFPKLIVSTLPYDIRPLLHGRDIVFFPSVADILGLNPMLRTVLGSAAAAMDGMARAWAPFSRDAVAHTIGATGIGITTPALLAARDLVEQAGFELASFHANGLGGAAFEEWIALRMFRGVLDLTTSELTSEIFGGIAVAGPDRLTTAGRLGLPQVVCPGGLDFVTRGPSADLDAADRARPHYAHSPTFTHVRIDAPGMRQVAAVVAARLNAATGPTAFVLPLHGFSAEGRPGGAIHDPAADEAFRSELRRRLAPAVRVVEVDAHINDPLFVRRACAVLFEQVGASVSNPT
ncbi:MAG: Tm-1-like ATP-binding domain-containing protein [Betaproteobacteria bacterium]|nr:Tm-1-like ATP-binding domain-containing protein [Betaproteobacteria bacterium]